MQLSSSHSPRALFALLFEVRYSPMPPLSHIHVIVVPKSRYKPAFVHDIVSDSHECDWHAFVSEAIIERIPVNSTHRNQPSPRKFRNVVVKNNFGAALRPSRQKGQNRHLEKDGLNRTLNFVRDMKFGIV